MNTSMNSINLLNCTSNLYLTSITASWRSFNSRTNVKRLFKINESLGIVGGKKCNIVRGVLTIGTEVFYFTYEELLYAIGILKSSKWKKTCLLEFMKQETGKYVNLMSFYKLMLNMK